jgi:hypothetical protein
MITKLKILNHISPFESLNLIFAIVQDKLNVTFFVLSLNPLAPKGKGLW